MTTQEIVGRLTQCGDALAWARGADPDPRVAWAECDNPGYLAAFVWSVEGWSPTFAALMMTVREDRTPLKSITFVWAWFDPTDGARAAEQCEAIRATWDIGELLCKLGD